MTQPISSDGGLTERAVFKCSPALLDVIDRASAASFSSRSDFIRAAVVGRLKREGMIADLAASRLKKTAPPMARSQPFQGAQAKKNTRTKYVRRNLLMTNGILLKELR